MNDFEQGIIAYNNKDFKQARYHFEQVLIAQPNNYVASHNLGITCVQLGLDTEALDYFTFPCQYNYVDSYISRGAAFRNLGRYQEALKDFATAFSIDPDCATAYSNYSNMLREYGRPDIALDFIKIANRLKPDNTSLLNESVTYLALGDLIEGWKKYNYRWFYETGESLKPNLPGPEYDGTQDVAGKIILVYHEQGFGDCIQFARYINLLENLKAKITIYSKPKLVKLFKHNYPNATVLEWGQDITEYHMHVALLDLPKCFNTAIDNIPLTSAYLSVDEKTKNDWRNILGPKTKKRIGLSWTSNGAAYNTRFRKMELSELVNVISDEYEFINLHFDPTPDDLQKLNEYNIVNVNQHLGDFYTTAGLISNLDCVITVDTVTAHLSGALGVPTFVLLPKYGCDWRWFLDRNDSPFYSCVKLFRKVNDNWDSVIQDLKRNLNNLG